MYGHEPKGYASDELETSESSKYKYLVSVLVDDGKRDTEIQRRIGIVKDAFRKLNQVLRNGNFLRSKE